jgi:hypothetical protein
MDRRALDATAMPSQPPPLEIAPAELALPRDRLWRFVTQAYGPGSPPDICGHQVSIGSRA